MGKFVIETVQIIKRKYYVKDSDSDTPDFVMDDLVMGRLDQFSSQFLTEDIVSAKKVKKFPMADDTDDVNAAVMIYDKSKGEYNCVARWDLCKLKD